MASYELGKTQIVKLAKQSFKTGASCLDVGPCDGIWYWLLGEHFKMDAAEIFEPYIDKYKLDNLYEHVFNTDIRTLRYKWYDFIIIGDVIEHMTPEEGFKVLNYAYDRCKDFCVAVPYMLEQDAINNNPNEIHVQADLTPQIVKERYPMLEPLIIYQNYGYYHKNMKYK